MQLAARSNRACAFHRHKRPAESPWNLNPLLLRAGTNSHAMHLGMGNPCIRLTTIADLLMES